MVDREAGYTPVAPSQPRLNAPPPGRAKVGAPLPASSGDTGHVPVAAQQRPCPSRRTGSSLETVSEYAPASSVDEDSPCLELDRNEIKLHKQIGSGVEADVFFGEWQGKQVAVKQIKHDRKRMSLKEQVSLAREVGIITQLSHKNLVAFYGTCFTQRPLLLVLELCEGGTVFELLHNCAHIELTWKQRLIMLRDVARALAYLHGLNPQILHRDLKSLNLLLTGIIRAAADIPFVKVTDFGLARAKEDDDVKMTSHVGSIYWMAPEVVKGSRYDEKVDVYSFAMVLYEVTCRDIPFDDFDPPEVASKILSGERPELDLLPDDCPDCLVKLLMECWEGDPAKRPAFQSILVSLESEDD